MDEELLKELRSNAEEYSDVTEAIKADIPGIDEDFLAVYYDATKRDDEVLRLMMTQRFGADKIGRLDNYYNKLRPAPETESTSYETNGMDDGFPAKDEGFFGKVASGTVNTAVDAPDMLRAGIANYAKSFTVNTLDGKGGDILMGFNKAVDSVPLLGEAADWLGVTRVSVDVTPRDEADLAGYMTALEGYQFNNKGLDQLTVGKRTRLHLNPDQLDALNGYTGQEGLQANFDTLTNQAAEADNRLDTAVSKFGAGLVEFSAAFIATPGGGAKVGRVGSIGIAMLRGAVADKTIIDPEDQNLARLAQELGVPGEDLWNIIATNDDDEQWKNEARIIIEGAALGGAADVIFQVLGAARKVHRGAGVEAVEEAVENSERIFKEATEARMLTAEEINASKIAEEVGEGLPVEAPTSAELILGDAKRKLSAVTFDADKAMDTFMVTDAASFTDEAIESATGIRKFSEWTEWDNIADVRMTISKHVDGVFEEANKRQSIDSMIKKAEAIRVKQMKDASDAPDWASAVITKREDAVQYINNVMVETTLARQLEAIREWKSYGSDPQYLPPFLKHLGGPNVTPKLREQAVAGYVEGLMSAAGVIGKKNETQISEAARVMATQRWIKYGKLKEAEADLENWIQKQKDAGNIEWDDISFGLNRMLGAEEITPSRLRQIVGAATDTLSSGASILVRFRNANLLANTKTIGINLISEAFGHTQSGSITRVYEGMKSLAKGKPMDGIQRIQLGLTFGVRQFAEIGKGLRNATQLFRDGIGEVSGSASAFDAEGKAIGRTFGEISKEGGIYSYAGLPQFTAGVNRLIGGISELMSSMAVYQKTRDDAILGQFGKKWQDIAKKRTLTQEEITQMFIENDMPSLLLRRTKTGNLIDSGAAENAAIIGFRESEELAGNSDKLIRDFRKAARNNNFGWAFDYLAPFAQTIAKISKRALMNGVPAPIWFFSKTFRKRWNSTNPTIRNLARAEFSVNLAAYGLFSARGFFESEDPEEARAQRIAGLKPGESIVAFDMIDEAIGFKEDKQGWIRITMMEDGETLKETHVLPQELNVIFSTAIAAQSVGRYVRAAMNDDPAKAKGVWHFMTMAAVGAPTASIRQNNLVKGFADSVNDIFKAGTGGVEGIHNYVAKNVGNFVAFAPGTRHLSEDMNKMFGDAESMEYNSELADDRNYKLTHNLGWLGAAYRQLTRSQDHEYLNVRRGPFGTPLPTQGRGLVLIAKSNEIGLGEKLFAEFMEHNAGQDADRLSARVTEQGLDLKEVRTAPNEHSLGDQMLENLGNVTISNMSIEEKMLYEFTNPLSKFSQMQAELEAATDFSVKRELIGERTAPFIISEQVRYLNGIRREYLEASKSQLMAQMPEEKQLEIEERIKQYSADYELIQLKTAEFNELMGEGQ